MGVGESSRSDRGAFRTVMLSPSRAAWWKRAITGKKRELQRSASEANEKEEGERRGSRLTD